MDTALHLECPGMSVLCQGSKRKWRSSDVTSSEDSISLTLGLGHSYTSSESCKTSMSSGCMTSSAKETDDGNSLSLALGFDLNLSSEPCSKTAPHCDLQLSLLSGPSVSINNESPIYINEIKPLNVSSSAKSLPSVKEGSVSSCWISGAPLQISFQDVHPSKSFLIDWTNSTAIGSDSTTLPDMPAYSSMKSSVTNTFGVSDTKPHRKGGSGGKSCKFQGCTKGARGASGLCIAHGGGRRCQREGCNKGAEGRTVYCKAHGGGRRCHFLGCTKSAEGRTDFCIAHGGGRRCSHENCTRAARGKSGLCIRHGGGKRCQKENCPKSAEGYSGFCIAHGGGRRCQFSGCTKGAQGSTFYCKAHGGGKRCTAWGCNKGAEGSTPFCKGHGGGKRCSFQGGGACPKSVHGGTMFCVAHGGGKRCAAPECTRSARGRTNYCVRHGGGKRCKAEGCWKSAQGRTDFCKAHGGGTRCSWGQAGSFHGIGDSPCDRFARGRTGLCTAHNSLVVDSQGHGASSLVSNITKHSQISELNLVKPVGSKDTVANVGQQQSGFIGWNNIDSRFEPQAVSVQPETFTLPEGRVHGGKLMEMLSNNSAMGSLTNCHFGAGPSNVEATGSGATRRWA